MKKFVLSILVIALVLIIASCADARNTGSTDSIQAKNNKEVIDEEVGNPSLPSESKTTSTKDILSLIPEGWHILERFEKLEKVEGDLNKDGVMDIALVIEETNKKKDESPNRSLLIAFGSTDVTYKLSVVTEKAILKADEGGVWGDPLDSISIDRGSLLVNFYGGSNWRWYGNYRFRYQNNDWFLIGATTGSFHTSTNEYTEESDYNLLTGDFIQKKADKTGKIHTSKGNRGKNELLKLVDFDASKSEEQYLK